MSEDSKVFLQIITMILAVIGLIGILILGNHFIANQHEYRMKMLESVTKPCAITEIERKKK